MSLHLKYIYLLFLCSSTTIWAQSTKPDKTDSVTTQQLENVIVTGVRNERPINYRLQPYKSLGEKHLLMQDIATCNTPYSKKLQE